MNKRSLRLMAAAVALVTSAGTVPTAFAQQQLSQMVGAMCPKFATQLAGKAEMASVLRARPIDVASVCSCTESTFASDQRLQQYMNVDRDALRERMKSEHLRSYVSVRLLQSVLACLAPELEASLAASSPHE